MTFGSLFSGIGGMDLGLERAGMECRWQVEIDPYCTKVLERHWPGVKRYGDIRTVTGVVPVDLIAGGFPCQDLSVAGRKAGINGARSGLWAEYFRLIGEIRPRFVLIENVSGVLANEPARRVLGDLSAIGFDAEWRMFRASDFGLFHGRPRVFIVAYAASFRPNAQSVLDREPTEREVLREHQFHLLRNGAIVRPVPVDCIYGVADGVSVSVEQSKGLGNAVVPQVAEWIGRRILEAAA